MKDTSHHLKHVQKKVVQSQRKESITNNLPVQLQPEYNHKSVKFPMSHNKFNQQYKAPRTRLPS